MTLSSLPGVTLLSVTVKQSAARAWVCNLATHADGSSTLFRRGLPLPSLGRASDAPKCLRGHLPPASAQGKLGLLFFPLAALRCSRPRSGAHPVTLQGLVHVSVSSSERAGSRLVRSVFPEDGTVPGTPWI